MKQKLLTLLTLLLTVCSGAWASTVDDLVAISSNYTFIADDITSNGTVALTENTLYDNGRIFTSTGNTVATNKGSNTFAGASHLNSLRIKNTQNVLAFKVSNDCTVTFYTQSHSSRGLQVGSTNGGTEYGKQSTSTSKFEVDVNAGVVYLSSFEGDLFIAGFEVSFGATGTKTPTITQSGSTVTLACGTSGASIYYTIDGTKPTTSSATYTAPISIDNSCTVRTFAQLDEDASEEVTKDCYVNHSSVANYLATLGYSGGSLNTDANVWTSTDGNYILTDNSTGRTIGYTNLAGSQDGFKINHTDTYTLQVGADIKVTKLVIVGKSWLTAEGGGNASTIAIDGFTPESGTFYEYPTDGETYVKSLEFNPTSELDYGAAINITPGTNQIGLWIEVYGVKRSGPAEPGHVAGNPITWDFTNLTATSFTNATSYSYTADDNSTEMRYTAGSSDAIETKNDNTYLKENGNTGGASCKDVDGTTAIAKNRLIRLFVTGKGTLKINCVTNTGVYKVYDSNVANTAALSSTALISSYTANTTSDEITVTNGLWIETTTKGYITSIVWTPASDDLILTTTANMAGYRAFYDAENSYTVDENTKVYVATANSATKVTLAEYANNNIPAGTPVILKTSADAESDGTFKMTLTKDNTVADFSGTNELKASTAGQNLGTVYRLGFGEDGVGFYKYTTSSAAAGIVYVENVSGGSGARSLTLDFADEATGIGASLMNSERGNSEVYNLNGQRVMNPAKGLYIVNGRKVVIK